MKYVINCKTEAEAKKLLDFLHMKGFVWGGGNDLTYTLWSDYKSDTCYRLDYLEWNKRVTYGHKDTYVSRGYGVVQCSDFMNDYQKYTNGFFGE